MKKFRKQTGMTGKLYGRARGKGTALFLLLLLLFAVPGSGCGKESREMSWESVLGKVQEKEQPEEQPEEKSRPEAEETSGQTETVETLWVHICGAVAVPGIYELPRGSRIYDGVEKAGGFTAQADMTHYNLAQLLTDGMKIEVPVSGESRGEAASQVQQNTETLGSGLLNINTATAEQLQTLPGIGKSRAADIIAYREKNGGFQKKTDIMKVSGIKESVYGKIKDLITAE